MRLKTALFLSFSVIAACGDDKSSGKEGNINISSNNKDLQMVAALKYGSTGRAHDEIRHFHVSGKSVDKLRMMENLYELLQDKDMKQVSVGCEDAVFCSRVLGLSLQRALENEIYREDFLLIIPSNLAPPYQTADRIGVSISSYELPSFEE